MSGADLLDVLVAACLVAGGLLSLLAGIGLLRFPDVLTRMHAATKPQVLGVLLILLALAVSLRNGADLATLVLIGGFQLATAPLAAQMIGRAAYRTGRVRADLLVADELADRGDGPGDGT
ncbi:monovalent cation/H(+) antiporter subunit G [Plantactinospora soyae]|uniref:Multicomponent Na+:H+ antiporter subunit G n=1 Tax=Plantactinospora soyae TaxID=1544732 RepID=A0A927R7M1_9ACTN|nr:monovalent cation/H(+) antiporter subunit G [Plantactinospora soyae]MBE1487981.1 multicomponent Na+:H+ antiporter subunit G [Plantactinospora soyae]